MVPACSFSCEESTFGLVSSPGSVVCVRGVGVGVRHLDRLLFRAVTYPANLDPWPDVRVRGLRGK